MTYIHEQPDWPRLTWNTGELAAPLAEVRHQQGRFLGKMETLGFDLRSEASLAARPKPLRHNDLRFLYFILDLGPEMTIIETWKETRRTEKKASTRHC